MTREWMAETGFKPERPGWWKQLISQIRVWLAEHGFGHLREADIETIIQDAFRGANRTNTRSVSSSAGLRSGTEGARFAAALRREGAPNHAGEAGKIVIGKMDTAPGFMEWAGLSGNGIYVDGEMLFGKHPEYFRNQIEAVSAVAFVLAAPEKANDVSGNKAFVRYDEESGRYFRIEIGNRVVGKRNQVRSVHELNQAQYEKAKVGIDSPVLQLSQTGYTKVVQPARSYSDFIKYYSNIQISNSVWEILMKLLIPSSLRHGSRILKSWTRTRIMRCWTTLNGRSQVTAWREVVKQRKTCCARWRKARTSARTGNGWLWRWVRRIRSTRKWRISWSNCVIFRRRFSRRSRSALFSWMNSRRQSFPRQQDRTEATGPDRGPREEKRPRRIME